MTTKHLICHLKSILLSLTLLFALSSGALAQLPVLEFLDHSEVETQLLGVEIVGDEIIYAAKNPRAGKTFVRVVGSDGKVSDLLDEPISFNSEAVFHMDSDGILWILLYNLVTGTLSNFSTDVVVLTYDGQSANILQLEGIRAEFSLSTTTSVALDSLNQIYALSEGSLYRVQQNSAEEITTIPSSGRLISNPNGAIFFIDKTNEILYSVDESGLTEVISLSAGFVGHRVFGDVNVLVYRNHIEVYDRDFFLLLTESQSPVEISSMGQLHLQDDGFFILNSEQDGTLEVFWIDENLVVEPIFSITEDLGQSQSLLYFTEDYLITAGEFELSDVSNQLFFRKFPRSGIFQPERVQISLSDFRVSFNRDTTIAGAPPLYIYDASYVLRSEDGGDYELIPLYSSPYLPSVSNSPVIHIRHHNIFEASSEVTMETELLTSLPFPYPMIAGIPGADYKFNASAMATVPIDVISDVANIVESKNIEVFPNPTSGTIHLKTDALPDLIEIYDLSGRKLYLDASPTSHSVYVGELTSGLYLIRVLEGERVYTGKFVRE